MPALYEEGVQLLKGIFRDSTASITWLSDGWTDSNTARGYVNIITNIINNFELQSFCIATRYLAESHTAPVLAKYVESVFTEYGLDMSKNGRFFACVTDNGKNFTNLVQKELQHFAIPCIAHTLNLVVKDAVEATPAAADLFEQFASAVEFFRRSSRAASKLAEEIPKHDAIIRQRLQRVEPGRAPNKQLPMKLKIVRCLPTLTTVNLSTESTYSLE